MQQQPAEPAPTASLLEVSRACGRWTVLPAVTGGKKQFRVLLRVDSGASSMLIPEAVHTVRPLTPASNPAGSA